MKKKIGKFLLKSEVTYNQKVFPEFLAAFFDCPAHFSNQDVNQRNEHGLSNQEPEPKQNSKFQLKNTISESVCHEEHWYC